MVPHLVPTRPVGWARSVAPQPLTRVSISPIYLTYSGELKGLKGARIRCVS